MNRKLVSVASAFVLIANSLVAVAQNPVPDKAKTEKRDVIINREFQVTADGSGSPDQAIIFNHTAPGTPGVPMMLSGQAGGNFGYATSQILMDGKVVKGKPYSAEIVSEHIQTLGDGNRIARKSNSSVARDSEGRIRQEATLQAFGPFAEAMKDLPKHITINDPVAGTTYLLNPKEKTAVKMPTFNIRIDKNISTSGAGTPNHEITVRRTSPDSAPKIVTTDGAGIQRVSGGVLITKATNKVQPQYPATAKAAGAQGAVQVRVVVNEKGEVITEDVVGGHPLLKDAAADAAKQWKFQPTEMNGQPVKVQGVLTFNFTLNDSPAPAIASTEKSWGLAAPASDVAMNQDIRIFRGGDSKYEKKTEPIGKQNIEGVECEGTRTVMTIPAGDLGNDNPINVITETWTSTDLQVTVLRKFNDPRFGEDIYRLTNISRSEPDKELFKVPADYKINDEGSMMPGQMMRTMEFSESGVVGEMKMRKQKRIEEGATKQQ